MLIETRRIAEIDRITAAVQISVPGPWICWIVFFPLHEMGPPDRSEVFSEIAQLCDTQSRHPPLAIQ